MNHASSFTLRQELVRYQMITLLYRLMATADELALPKLSMALTQARRQLETNRYHVLVMGEAKRGKTTFINALMGQAILPVDAQGAMRQGVCVSLAAQEGYRLRFEDGSHQDIAAADVYRYGTQEVEPAADQLRSEHIVRCIEVDVPMPLLPEGISFWDMPDVEGLAITPTAIIQRFALHVDAVIYVLDSSHVIEQPDLDAIESILAVTSHIFFIQNKIDQHALAHWEGVRQANQDLLSTRFSNRLRHCLIWPVSSAKLWRAVQVGGDEAAWQSRQELCTALHVFLFQVAGRGRMVEALMVAQRDHALSRQTLAGRLSTVTEVPQEGGLAAVQHQATERQHQFELEWGPTGAKRQTLLANLQHVMSRGRQNFDAALRLGGEIERHFQSQVEALTSMNAAKQLSSKLRVEVVTAAMNHWLQVCEFTQKECMTLMAPFFVEAITLPQTTNPPGIRLDAELNVEQEWVERLITSSREMAHLSALAGLPLTILIGASAVTGPLGVLALTATGLWGFVHGWTTSGQKQIDEARARLSQHLSALLQEVRNYFFNTELTADSLSIVDQYFEGLRRLSSERIEALATQKAAEAQAEIARVLEHLSLDHTQRQEQVQQMQQHIASWDAIGVVIPQLTATLGALEHEAVHDTPSGLGTSS